MKKKDLIKALEQFDDYDGIVIPDRERPDDEYEKNFDVIRGTGTETGLIILS